MTIANLHLIGADFDAGLRALIAQLEGNDPLPYLTRPG
jgi:hypothetical protein